VVLFGKAFIAFRGKVEIAFFDLYIFLRKQHLTKIPISYLVQMIVWVNRFLLRKKFNGMTLWPFVILKNRQLKGDKILLNHERIHLRQQVELLVILFYLWYGIEFLIRLLQHKDRRIAYRSISFEREAYAKEKDLEYLKTRPFWKFISYL
jgi:hypothetical protein